MSWGEPRRPFSFDELAPTYDAWYNEPLGGMYDRIEKRAVAEMLPSPKVGERLLEIGCGTGHWTCFLVERGFLVVGVDISPKMIQKALEKEIVEARFQLGDALSLPFADDTFDVALAITTLEFVVDPEGALREMVRCVRPGGSVVVGVLNRISWLGLRRKLRGASPFKEARLFSPKELKGLLSRHGQSCVRAVAFVVPTRWGLKITPALDFLGRVFRLPWGDFLVGHVSIR